MPKPPAACPPPDAATAERLFEDLRRAPPDLLAACAAALDPRDPAYAQWLNLAHAIIAELDQVGVELAYHNRHHFAEATRAMGWLCQAACARGLIAAADVALGVVAMLGHDIGHDGSATPDGRLEAASAARVTAIAAAAGMDPALTARLSDIILATAPALVARNADGAHAHLLRRLANEADVFASLLPRLGRRLGEALAVERGFSPARPGQHRERLDFLRVYDRFTPAAIDLGLARLQADQVAAYAQVCGPDPRSGAEHLDHMSQTAGQNRYDRLLAGLQR